ncbi:MAG TPA: hypothetical protein VGP55_10530 [Chitinophagaceae bacterium]|nr:hypothetical protein [Chitinophagaceae bacterium]
MKNIIISIAAILINLSTFAQSDTLSVKGSDLREQTDTIKMLSDKISSQQEMANKSLAEKARTISRKIIICKNSLAKKTNYPYYLKQLFSNYESVLNLALNTNNPDSAANALDFVEQDLSAKTVFPPSSDGTTYSPYYDTTPMNVRVVVVDSNGVSLNGYEVKARPFFMLDPASAFNFHGLTNSATENIIPGWYMFMVQKGSFKKEKDFKILRTHTEPVLLNIPVGN